MRRGDRLAAEIVAAGALAGATRRVGFARSDYRLAAGNANSPHLAADNHPACVSPRNGSGHGAIRATRTPASIGLARLGCQSRWPEGQGL